MRLFIRYSLITLCIFLLVIPAFASEYVDLQEDDDFLIDVPPESLDILQDDSIEDAEIIEDDPLIPENLDVDKRDLVLIGDQIVDVSGLTEEELQELLQELEEAEGEELVDDNLPAVFFLSPNTLFSPDVYLDIPDEPPSNSPFYGQWYIRGHDGSTQVVIYTANSDGWGVDNNGYLVRLGGSATGQMYVNGSIPNSSSLPAYGYPRYRPSATGTQIDLHIVPDYSNINIYSDFPLRDNSLGFDTPSYVMLFAVGLIAVILLVKRK